MTQKEMKRMKGKESTGHAWKCLEPKQLFMTSNHSGGLKHGQ